MSESIDSDYQRYTKGARSSLSIDYDYVLSMLDKELFFTLDIENARSIVGIMYKHYLGKYTGIKEKYVKCVLHRFVPFAFRASRIHANIFGWKRV